LLSEKCPKVIFVSDGLKRLGGRLEKVIFVIIILIILIIGYNSIGL